jgi:hypothetical protein
LINKGFWSLKLSEIRSQGRSPCTPVLEALNFYRLQDEYQLPGSIAVREFFCIFEGLFAPGSFFWRQTPEFAAIS